MIQSVAPNRQSIPYVRHGEFQGGWQQHKFRVFAGATLALSGAAATFTIGALRIIPSTVALVGLSILSSLVIQPSKKSKTAFSPDKVRQIHQKPSSWKMLAMALAIVTIAFPLYYGMKIAGANSSTDILPLTTANPDRPIATTDVPNLAVNNTLQEINGNSIKKIEMRGHSTFLGESESFLEILKEDTKTVRAMGVTHIELAEHLAAIQKYLTDNRLACHRPSLGSKYAHINAHFYPPREDILASMSEYLFSRPREDKYGFPSLSDVIFYNPHWLKDNTIGKGTQTQLLLACSTKSWGIQEDIFASSIDWEFKGSWSGNIEIINPINGVKLTIGDGVIDYIRKYGFYEGCGDDGHNPYRVDPVDIVAILTGKSPSSIREAISQFHS